MTGADQSEIIKAAVTLQYQGVGIRFISFLIDSIVLVLLIGVVGSILGFSVVSRTAGWGFGLLSFYHISGLFYLFGRIKRSDYRQDGDQDKSGQRGWRNDQYEPGLPFADG